MNKIIEVSGLKKSYGSIQAVKGIDFYVEEGSLFAFLGPNGAGKSTTIDILSTLLEPNEGRIVIDDYEIGRDDSKIRSELGIVFQNNLQDDLLTVKENLQCRGSLYGLKGSELKNRMESAIDYTEVRGFLNQPYGKLSGGQRRRADIARALINQPKILILDEPTTGLDPQTRQRVWETIREIQRETGMTVFLTTHYMEEAANADYVVVIDNGEIVAKGTPSQIKEEYSSDYLEIHGTDIQKLSEILEQAGHEYEVKVDTLTIKLSSTLDALPILEQCKEDIIGFQVVKGTMDDAFITITGKELRE
ncbi:ABC transporter ATP-binding protein [Robertmurraya yapensis]|uniref:ABC transporter ATP-binding protein n=2 Tax=Bacillaceae TaxID=186817 RepID=A0A431VXE5_9BACI|nr:ABC transporter ATP-binding protein [Bacillus yapensis]RTR27813.1 ABC transporter ATP-binding protein [Bacillus yapensis]TKS94216.1 ATP-binding cassette domain-containing protein [Bacillus yapensis]